MTAWKEEGGWRRHGKKLYRTWINIRARCAGAEDSHFYQYYKARGITVCSEWENFDTFVSDMGQPPSESHTIDRIDNDKGYSKENCRWATQQMQVENSRIRSDNTSGVKGVCFSGEGKWLAKGWNGRQIHLYKGSSFEEACAARKRWEESRGA